VIDPLTFEVTLPKPDKLALPNLATVYPIIINSKVAKEHATADIPGRRVAEEHTAGSGAYKIETSSGRAGDHRARRELESRIGRQAGRLQASHHPVGPEPATRANLSSAATPISSSICRRRCAVAGSKGKLKVISTRNTMPSPSFDEQPDPPFDNINVRRAIAYGCLRRHVQAALFWPRGAAVRRDWAMTSRRARLPIPQPVKLDIDKAKAYLKEAACRTASRHVQLQCRPGFDCRTDGGLSRNPRQDRHQGRYPEIAGCADVDADQ